MPREIRDAHDARRIVQVLAAQRQIGACGRRNAPGVPDVSPAHPCSSYRVEITDAGRTALANPEGIDGCEGCADAWQPADGSPLITRLYRLERRDEGSFEIQPVRYCDECAHRVRVGDSDSYRAALVAGELPPGTLVDVWLPVAKTFSDDWTIWSRTEVPNVVLARNSVGQLRAVHRANIVVVRLPGEEARDAT